MRLAPPFNIQCDLGSCTELYSRRDSVNAGILQYLVILSQTFEAVTVYQLDVNGPVSYICNFTVSTVRYGFAHKLSLVLWRV